MISLMIHAEYEDSDHGTKKPIILTDFVYKTHYYRVLI